MKDDNSTGAFALVPAAPTTEDGARAAAIFAGALRRTERLPYFATSRGAKTVSSIQLSFIPVFMAAILVKQGVDDGVIPLVPGVAYSIVGLLALAVIVCFMVLPSQCRAGNWVLLCTPLKEAKGCQDALDMCAKSTWADAVRQTALNADRELLVADLMEMGIAAKAQRAFIEAESAAAQREEEARREAAACLELHAA